MRDDLAIEAIDDAARQARYLIHDPCSDASFVLGKRELTVARMFDGTRSIEQIVTQLREDHAILAAVAKIQQFEERMLKLGILIDPVRPALNARSPSAGITYGPFKRFLMLTLLRFDPRQPIEAIARHLPWLMSKSGVAVFSAVILGALMLLVQRWGVFTHDLATVYTNDLGWIPLHYAVVVGSIVVHEFGHAIACRAYRVRVTEIGVAVYVLILTGWAWPVQRDWSKLHKGARVMTILGGPFGSLLFAAVAVLVWSLAKPGSALWYLAVVAAASPTVALIPTLLPIFNGDTYLALTELLDMPRIRQRAFQALFSAVRGNRPALTRGEMLTYAALILSTLAGWAIAWLVLIRMLISIISTISHY
ncbi:M50 family metallopeptidase [Paraherbaspirillum soli]|uniref:M50 family metallopeptidase n=1 Tax=Paraherbaspirillum soli TaxID=631222 RepID=A0ABW0MB89_9BURK